VGLRHNTPTTTFTMVLTLALKAELNGCASHSHIHYILANLCRVTDLRPQDTEESPFFYSFKVQCTSCRETHPNFVSISRFEKNDVSGGKGEANFVWRCKNCKVTMPVLALSNMA
jgi:hypothetical protein